MREYGAPLHSPHTFPSFDDRLRLMAIQIVQFRHMLTSAPELLDFIAGDIIDKLGGLSTETVDRDTPFRAADTPFQTTDTPFHVSEVL